jgi:multidrug efflux pump subunit AcrA (membrane-fusion protein)
LWAALIVLAGIAAFLAQQRRDVPRPVRQVRTAVVRRGPIERTLRVSGITSSSRLAHLFAPRLRGTRTRGSDELRLEIEMLAKSGTAVRKGAILAEFDRQLMQLRLDDYRASVEQQEATLLRLRANLALRRARLEQRVRVVKGETEKFALDLKTAPVRSDMQVQRYRMNHGEALARYQQVLKEVPLADASETALIRVYEIEVEQRKAELAMVQQNLDQMQVRAPIDGILVLSREYRGGEYHEFQQGDSVGPGRSFGAVMATGSMLVEASVNQTDAAAVRAGQQARVRFDGLPDLEVPGRVVAVAAFPSRGGYRAQYVRQVPLRLELANAEERVTPNLTAGADIVLERAEDAVIVPKECVFGDKPVAYVHDGGGWQKRELTLGIANHVEVAVEAGLAEGERVAAEDPTVSPF